MTKRKELLPGWLKGVSYLFLVFLATPLLFIVGLFLGSLSFSIYGINFKGPVYSFTSIALLCLLTSQGVAALGLLKGKCWGIYAGIVVAIFISLISAGSMIYALFNGRFMFEFSFVFSLIFLNELLSIKDKWLQSE